jgi:hypothetical protein
MQRPEVRLIQDQQVETNENPNNIDNWEAEQLLRKYGYQNTQYSTHQELPTIDDGLTFDQMIAQEEAKKKNEEMRRLQETNGPKPISFDGRNGYHTETKYGSDDDSGYGFKIQVTSDMPIPKY